LARRIGKSGNCEEAGVARGKKAAVGRAKKFGRGGTASSFESANAFRNGNKGGIRRKTSVIFRKRVGSKGYFGLGKKGADHDDVRERNAAKGGKRDGAKSDERKFCQKNGHEFEGGESSMICERMGRWGEKVPGSQPSSEVDQQGRGFTSVGREDAH